MSATLQTPLPLDEIAKKGEVKGSLDDRKHMIRLRGYLMKKSPKAVLGRHVWQRRFFVLEHAWLKYYKKDVEQLQDVLGIISIPHIEAVYIIKNKTPERFDIKLKEVDRVFQLKADTPDDAKLWVDAVADCLGKAVASLAPSSPPSSPPISSPSSSSSSFQSSPSHIGPIPESPSTPSPSRSSHHSSPYQKSQSLIVSSTSHNNHNNSSLSSTASTSLTSSLSSTSMSPTTERRMDRRQSRSKFWKPNRGSIFGPRHSRANSTPHFMTGLAGHRMDIVPFDPRYARGATSKFKPTGPALVAASKKDEAAKQRLREWLCVIAPFKTLNEETLDAVIEGMWLVKLDKAKEIVVQGERLREFCLVEKGSISVIEEGFGGSIAMDSKRTSTLSPGSSFGELALMYETRAGATYHAASSGVILWVIDGPTFQTIVSEHRQQTMAMYERFLKGITIFSSLKDSQVTKIAEELQEVTFPDGTVIVKQGDEGDRFYLLKEGECVVTKKVLPEEFAESSTSSSSSSSLSFTGASSTSSSSSLTSPPSSPFPSNLAPTRASTSSTNTEKSERSSSSSDTSMISSASSVDTVSSYLDGKKDESKFIDEEVYRYKKSGDYFGERCFITKDKRAATITAVGKVKCLVLERRWFYELLGPVEEQLRERVHLYEEQDKERERKRKNKGGVSSPDKDDRASPGTAVLSPFSPNSPNSAQSDFNHTSLSTLDPADQLGPLHINIQPVSSPAPGPDSSGSRKEGKRPPHLHLGHRGSKPSPGPSGSTENHHRQEDHDKRRDDRNRTKKTPSKSAKRSHMKEKEDSTGGGSRIRFHFTQEDSDSESDPEDSDNGPDSVESSQIRPEITVEDFHVIGTLGKGSFGHVQLVEDKKTAKTYALKSVSKAHLVRHGQQAHILSEKRVMQQLNHPFVVRLLGTFKDKNCLHFLMEPSLGGELFSLMRKKRCFPEKQARFYAASVVLIFEFMHSKNIIYRDLKPENLLLDEDGYIKLTDFGFALQTTKRTYTMCGTPDYLAPEMVASQGHGKGVDWWTLGIFIYEMLMGTTPFADSRGPSKIYEKIMIGKINFPPTLTEEVKDLLKGLLEPKATHRLGVLAGGAQRIKDHTWFAGFDWESLAKRKVQPPYKKTVRNKYDLTNFDTYPDDTVFDEYEDDGSNWDEDF